MARFIITSFIAQIFLAAFQQNICQASWMSDRCGLKCQSDADCASNKECLPWCDGYDDFKVCLTCNCVNNGTCYRAGDPEPNHLQTACDCPFGYAGDTCAGNQTFTSVLDLVTENPGASSGEYTMVNSANETFQVYIELSTYHMYTYIRPTSLDSIDIETLSNNGHEVMIRLRFNNGVQKEFQYGQLSTYQNLTLSVQYNSAVGFQPINNTDNGPYLYVGLLPDDGTTDVNDTQGYGIYGCDQTFVNSNGDPNSYLAILFNAANTSLSDSGTGENFMTAGYNNSEVVPSERHLNVDYFAQFEMRMGGGGGFITSDLYPPLTGVSVGLRYDLLNFTSCNDVKSQIPNAASGEWNIRNNAGLSYDVYCDFQVDHIYTYIKPTRHCDLNIDDLFNNANEIKIRHRTNGGVQKEATFGQITQYQSRNISLQYNSATGYANIRNIENGPFVYAGLLPIVGINHKNDTQGYSVNNVDYTFTNCDGNPNSYFALLFNKTGVPLNKTGTKKGFMTKWKSQATSVSFQLPNDYFSGLEMHMGGCGGFVTNEEFTNLAGATIGLRHGYPDKWSKSRSTPYVGNPNTMLGIRGRSGGGWGAGQIATWLETVEPKRNVIQSQPIGKFTGK